MSYSNHKQLWTILRAYQGADSKNMWKHFTPPTLSNANSCLSCLSLTSAFVQTAWQIFILVYLEILLKQMHGEHSKDLWNHNIPLSMSGDHNGVDINHAFQIGITLSNREVYCSP